jgi:hypothetical protein
VVRVCAWCVCLFLQQFVVYSDATFTPFNEIMCRLNSLVHCSCDSSSPMSVYKQAARLAESTYKTVPAQLATLIGST